MPRVVEYEFPVTCSCGHTEILLGPNETYELRALEEMLSVPCCACNYARKTLDALASGDRSAAQQQGMEWVQFMIAADDERTAALAAFIERTLHDAPGVTL